MDATTKVAIVILSWNGKKFLQEFLPSVVLHSPSSLCEIIVADNCSTDDSVQWIETNYPEIRVIKNKRNGGYAGGYNDALKEINADYYVLLNQDIEVTDKWVEYVIREMEKDLNVAAAQPKLLDFYQRDMFEYAGASGGYLDKFSYAFCRGRLFNTLEKDNGQYDDLQEIFWASGACLFVRAKVFREVGGFDEDFFAHQEEIDLCWRIKNRGYKVLCTPSSVVYHVGGGSLPQGNARKTYLNFRNNLMMMFMNLPIGEMIWKVFFVRFPMDALAAVHSVIKRRTFSDLIAILKAHISFLFAVPSLVKKRKDRSGFSSAHLSDVNIVWQYFVKRKRKYSELPL